MPFTISHAAAVLPLRSLARLPLAALMIGSLSPDFAYFLPGNLDRLATHDVAGLFWFCWPLGLAVWLAYVYFLEVPTFALAPDAWRDRFARSERRLGPRTLLLASLAVILGAITHDIWDAFTHWNTAITSRFPIFYARVMPFRGGHLRLFHLLQYLSSIFGLVVLAWWAFRQRPLPQALRPAIPAISRTFRLVAISFMVLSAVALAIGSYWIHAEDFFDRPVFYVAVDCMVGWLAAWSLVAIVIHWRMRC